MYFKIYIYNSVFFFFIGQKIGIQGFLGWGSERCDRKCTFDINNRQCKWASPSGFFLFLIHIYVPHMGFNDTEVIIFHMSKDNDRTHIPY